MVASSITPMFPPSTAKRPSQYSQAANLGIVKTGFSPFDGASVALLRDNFTISTWLFLGCVIQGVLALALPRTYAILPAVLFLAWGMLDAFAIGLGLKKNSWMDGVIVGKFSVAYPTPGQGPSISGQPGDNGPGAVMILGSRSNSPLGMFAPGFKEVGDRFRDMVQELETTQEVSGFMGMSSWLGAGERTSSSEYATISYWRSIEDIHNFALSPVHRSAWEWWNKNLGKHSHIGLMHEIFEVPKRNGWEGIYTNYHPTGLAATTKMVEGDEKDQGTEWVNPIIDARRGAYRSSRGRMGRGDVYGSSNEKVVMDPYAQY